MKLAELGQDLDFAVNAFNKADFGGVITRVRSRYELTPQEIESVPEESFVNYMLIMRLLGASEVSESQKQRLGKPAIKHLQAAETVFTTIYDYPRIREGAEKTNLGEGLEGAYNLASEMARDKGKQALYSYHLLGNPGLLDLAISYFSRAISLANPTSSTVGVATMEAQIASLEKTRSLDFPLFQDAYNWVMDKATDWNRKATVSRWYSVTALRKGQFKEAWRGWKNVKEECSGHVNHFKFFARELIRPVADLVRKFTLKMP